MFYSKLRSIAFLCTLLLVKVLSDEDIANKDLHLGNLGENDVDSQTHSLRHLIPMPIPPSTNPPGMSSKPTAAPTTIDLSKTPCADAEALNCVCDSSKCLAVFKKKRKWAAANQFCRRIGWHMALIISPFDQNLLETLELRLKPKRYAWFGLRDKDEEGEFRWNGNVPPLFLNWGGEGEPGTEEHNNRDCVGVANDHRWYVLGCHRKFKTICQKKY